MKTIHYKVLFAALALNILVFSNAWAGRILISDADQTVTLNRSLDCYQAAEITIDTSRPEIYEAGSKQLQLVSDTVRAMLNYECPSLSQINITGHIRGLNEMVYQGQLTQRGNWLVQSLTSSAMNQLQGDTREPQAQTNWQTDPREISRGLLAESLSVTNLELGMTVSEVSKIVKQTFDIKPKYDAEKGLMTMLAGGCPSDFDVNRDHHVAQADWKCLKAWFSDTRIARLERLELVQVVKTDKDNVQQLLVDKYGHPNEAKVAGSDAKAKMVWRAKDERNASAESVQSLSAEVSEIDANLVVTSLTLFTQAANEHESISYADVGLRL